jgi:hypothetical protein
MWRLTPKIQSPLWKSQWQLHESDLTDPEVSSDVGSSALASPTSLPKPSPPSPPETPTRPVNKDWVDNVYSRKYASPNGLSDDTLPLGSPWISPIQGAGDPVNVEEESEAIPSLSPVPPIEEIFGSPENIGCDSEDGHSSTSSNDEEDHTEMKKAPRLK